MKLLKVSTYEMSHATPRGLVSAGGQESLREADSSGRSHKPHINYLHRMWLFLPHSAWPTPQFCPAGLTEAGKRKDVYDAAQVQTLVGGKKGTIHLLQGSIEATPVHIVHVNRVVMYRSP